MATNSETETTVQGIILRTSAGLYSPYAYISFPRAFPPVANNNGLNALPIDCLTNVPHFPDITILDSIGYNILYQTHDSLFPVLFHVYNLINRSHFHLSFPYASTYLHAAMIIHQSVYFKVLVVCVGEHQNPFDDDGAKPLVFYAYTSKSKGWSWVPNPSSSYLTVEQLPSNRRKPIHAVAEAVFLDLTDRFLVHFGSMTSVRVDLVPKPISAWESDLNMVDVAARYGGCNEFLHCLKINPFNRLVEIWRLEALVGTWGSVVSGEKINVRGTVVGLHPELEGLVFMRSEFNDEILLVDFKQDLKWVLAGGSGPNCGIECCLRGVNRALGAALEGGGGSGCGFLHPHENAEGPEGEIFIVSNSEMNLDFH